MTKEYIDLHQTFGGRSVFLHRTDDDQSHHESDEDIPVGRQCFRLMSVRLFDGYAVKYKEGKLGRWID